jgi:hypothetical protein
MINTMPRAEKWQQAAAWKKLNLQKQKLQAHGRALPWSTSPTRVRSQYYWRWWTTYTVHHLPPAISSTIHLDQRPGRRRPRRRPSGQPTNSAGRTPAKHKMSPDSTNFAGRRQRRYTANSEGLLHRQDQRRRRRRAHRRRTHHHRRVAGATRTDRK